MTLAELNKLSLKELNKLKRVNSVSYHSFMLASVCFLIRACSEINPIVLLLSFGLAITARAFYSNIRTVDLLRHERSKL